MEQPPTSDAAVRQGRVLAIVATLVVPFLIAAYGTAAGYPTSVVVPALIIWGSGTTLWLRSVWPRLRADKANDRVPPSNNRR